MAMVAAIMGSPLCLAQEGQARPQADAMPPTPIAPIAPVPAPALPPGVPGSPPSATAPADKPAGPLISLLLPLNAADFAPAANAVQQGCDAALAAATPRGGSEVIRTDASPATVREAWNAAAGHGAAVVVGPLTRDAVTALAGSLLRSPASNGPGGQGGNGVNGGGKGGGPVTLALNTVDAVSGGGSGADLPPGFYTFGLPLEAEARAVADLAWNENARSMIVVQSRHPLGTRAGAAFAAAWRARGGHIARIETFQGGAELEAMRARFTRDHFSDASRERPDAVFLAADADEARLARPYLGNSLPVYATSQVNDGQRNGVANLDLGGVRFVDMPWLLQPDHPAVMVYPRPPESMGADLQRLYALGIDACRLATLFAAGPRPGSRIALDGVTGALSVRVDDGRRDLASHTVTREPLAASFVSSAGVAVDGQGGDTGAPRAR